MGMTRLKGSSMVGHSQGVLARVMSRMETNDMSFWGGGGTRGSEARQIL